MPVVKPDTSIWCELFQVSQCNLFQDYACGYTSLFGQRTVLAGSQFRQENTEDWEQNLTALHALGTGGNLKSRSYEKPLFTMWAYTLSSFAFEFTYHNFIYMEMNDRPWPRSPSVSSLSYWPKMISNISDPIVCRGKRLRSIIMITSRQICFVRQESQLSRSYMAF